MSEKQLRTNSRNKVPKWLVPAGAIILGLAAVAGCSSTEAGNNQDSNSTIERSDMQLPTPITGLSEIENMAKGSRLVIKDGVRIELDALMATQKPKLLCEMGIDGINSHAQIEQDLAILNAEILFTQTEAFNNAKLEPTSEINFNGKIQTNSDAITYINWDIDNKAAYLPYIIQAEKNAMSMPLKVCNDEYNPENAMLDENDVNNPDSLRVIESDELLDEEYTYEWINNNGDCLENIDALRLKNQKIDNPQTWDELGIKINDIKLQFRSYVAGAHIVPCKK